MYNMKKLSIIVVCLLTTLFSYSQDFNKIIKASKSEYKDDKWVTIETGYPTDMFVIIKGWDITIGTHKFKTYDDYEKTTYDSHVTFTWKCVNGNGEKCHFMMKKFKPEITSHSLYSIIYDSGIMYEYETE